MNLKTNPPILLKILLKTDDYSDIVSLNEARTNLKKQSEKISVTVIGCGLIGQRRAKIVSQDPGSFVKTVVDVNGDHAKNLADSIGCQYGVDWEKAVADPEINVVVVSTPNHLLSPVACESLKFGKDVLIEKPMGKNLDDAVQMQKFAVKNKRRLKVGFNHRYHPAISKAYQLFKTGLVGDAINIRCQYGHGGRKGYEKEWRGNPELAGGGELTDQGVHLIDLIQWFCGEPSEVFAALQTAFWPIKPSEDNGFAVLKYKNGLIANFHSSWTQWKNLFNFEIFGTKGSLSIHGLGGSYGTETLTVAIRKPEGGVPEIQKETFEGPDDSWKKEWDDFVSALIHKTDYWGNEDEGVSVMKTLDALYKSHRLNRVVRI